MCSVVYMLLATGMFFFQDTYFSLGGMELSLKNPCALAIVFLALLNFIATVRLDRLLVLSRHTAVQALPCLIPLVFSSVIWVSTRAESAAVLNGVSMILPQLLSVLVAAATLYLFGGKGGWYCLGAMCAANFISVLVVICVGGPAAFLFCLYDPFIDIWLGQGYLLYRPAVLLIVLNFYVNSMRIPVNNTKGVLGLFWDDRYKSILEAVFNLALSVLLARRWGVAGILAGTLISTLAFPFWCEPLVLCRRGLRISPGAYFAGYGAHLAVTAAAGGLTWLLCRPAGGGFGWFLWRCLLCTLAPNAVYLIVYRRTEELTFFKREGRAVLKRLL